MLMEVIKQGACARVGGRPRDACPHPGESRERRAWLEGYDGTNWEFGARAPHPTETVSSSPPLPDRTANAIPDLVWR